MYEVVIRRLQDEKTGLPDLMLIDGGRQHLAVVEKAMEQLGVTVPAVAIAKPDDRLFVTWKEDPIYLPPRMSGNKFFKV